MVQQRYTQSRCSGFSTCARDKRKTSVRGVLLGEVTRAYDCRVTVALTSCTAALDHAAHAVGHSHKVVPVLNLTHAACTGQPE